jgi:hypothetical protein
MNGWKIPLLIESASGYLPVSVVVGIPQEQFLELIARFPEKGWSGQNPKVNEAIRDGITDAEKKKIAALLRILHANFTFVFDTYPRFIDEAKQQPVFESNGKKFWIVPH